MLAFHSTLESSRCDPNPCLNGGFCIEDGTKFSCVCNGTATGYGGLTCGAIIIHFPPIPPVVDESLNIPIILYVNVNEFPEGFDDKLRVTIEDRRHRVVTINREQRTPTSVRGEKGIVKVTLPEDTKEVLHQPRERDVFVSGTLNSNRQSYFERFNLSRGLLQPGCCSADITLSCPGDSTQTISLLSPCQWRTTDKDVTRTDAGVVFVRSRQLSLPTSLSSFRYRNRGYLNDIRDEIGECVPCHDCNITNSQCSCYNHTSDDTVNFLQARALAFTYISQIQHLLPSWLELFMDLTMVSESIGSAKNDIFAPVTRSSQPVASFEGCHKLTNLVGSRYSVLRYDKTLSAMIDGQRYDYRENIETSTTGGTTCFAVDLCHESESPVHMQISNPINDILVSQFLNHFVDRKWNILLHTVSVFKRSVSLRSSTTFWNGIEMILLPEVEADVSVGANVSSVLDEDSLNVNVEFNGNATLKYTVSL